jgi:hypothetical protein
MISLTTAASGGLDIPVRMILPSLPNRREIDRSLSIFFRDHRPAAFRRAMSELCRFYDVRQPRVGWYEYIDWGKTAGKTFEDGRVHLVHPENWKRGRVYKSERQWIATVYHEMGHYLFWSYPERKAEMFTYRMVRGLRSVARAKRAASRRGMASRRIAERRRKFRAAAARIKTRRKRARG